MMTTNTSAGVFAVPSPKLLDRMRERLEKHLKRRAKELGYEVRKIERVTPDGELVPVASS